MIRHQDSDSIQNTTGIDRPAARAVPRASQTGGGVAPREASKPSAACVHHQPRSTLAQLQNWAKKIRAAWTDKTVTNGGLLSRP